jgi:peptide/nickel transport system permease protein
VRRLVARLGGVVVVVLLTTAAAWLLFRLLRPSLFAGQSGSVPAQLEHFLARAFLHFDFGRSQSGSERPVADLIREGLPADVSLLAGGLLFGLAAGALGAIACARRPRGAASRAGQLLALVAMGAPVYVVGLTLLLVFGDDIGIFGTAFGIPLHYVPFSDSPLRWLGSLVVPWIVLGLPLAGMCLRVMLGELVEVSGEDYVRAARAKGLSERRVRRHHVAPAALAPTAMFASAALPLLITNGVLVERVFSVPGAFSNLNTALSTANVTLLLGLTAVGALLITTTTLLFDLFLWWLDPRVRHSSA